MAISGLDFLMVRLKHVHRPMSPCLGVSHMVQAFLEQERTACLHLLLLEAQSEGQEIVIRAEWGTVRRCRLDFFMTTFPLRCHSEFLTLGWCHLLGDWLKMLLMTQEDPCLTFAMGSQHNPLHLGDLYDWESTFISLSHLIFTPKIVREQLCRMHARHCSKNLITHCIHMTLSI